MNSSTSAQRSATLRRSQPEIRIGRATRTCVRWSRSRRRRSPATRPRRTQGLWTRRTTGGSASIRTLRLNEPPMSAHPAPRATRSIRAETAGSSGLALDPNQRGKAGGEAEASISGMGIGPPAHPRNRAKAICPEYSRGVGRILAKVAPTVHPSGSMGYSDESHNKRKGRWHDEHAETPDDNQGGTAVDQDSTEAYRTRRPTAK